MNVNAIVSSTPRSTAGAPPTPQDTGPADSFANLLDREQAPPPDTAADANETTASADSPQTADRGAAQRTARSAKSVVRPGEHPAAHAPARMPGEADHKTEPAQAQDTATTRPEAAPADPALLHWLQGLNLPTPPAGGAPEAGRAARAAPAAPQGDGADGGELAALTPQAGGQAAASRAAGREHRVEGVGDRAASARDVQALRGEVVAQAETARAVESAAPRFQDTLAALRAPSAEEAAATSAAGAATTNTAAADPALQAAQATLPVPLDDPQFPRAFGVQVSVLARDGVQQAELHLNPADMGPVSIQIVMDGTQARIDFGADAAPTRALIEHSLPDLAAALREAGLTLAGGGVSQHAGGRDPGGGAADPQRPGAGRTAADAIGGETAARRTHRHVRAGGVDLYA